jgi:hypothetical protein
MDVVYAICLALRLRISFLHPITKKDAAADKPFSDVFPVGCEAIHLRIWHETRSNTGRDVPFESI